MNNLEYILMYYGFPILGLIITSIAQLFITTNYSKYKKVLSKNNTLITNDTNSRMSNLDNIEVKVLLLLALILTL